MQRAHFSIFALACAVLALAVTGCGGGGDSPVIPVAAVSTSLSSTTLTFTSSTPVTFTVSEPGYSGAFTATSANPTIASITEKSSVTATRKSDVVKRDATTTATFTVTPVSGGTTSLTISDTIGNSTKLTVTVTSATFTPQQQR